MDPVRGETSQKELDRFYALQCHHDFTVSIEAPGILKEQRTDTE